MSPVLGDCPFRSIAVRLRAESNQPLPEGGLQCQLSQIQPPLPSPAPTSRRGAITTTTRPAHLAPDVHVLAVSVDPGAPRADLSGIDAYMEGLVQFGQLVVPGTTRVDSSVGDHNRALLHVTSKVKFGPDAPEMDHHQARLYRLDEDQKIVDEQVIFFALAR